MVQYTLAQSPEVVLTVSGRDSAKAREKAMAQLVELMDAGKLDTDLSEGFSPQQFIEVKEPASSESDQEDAVTQAVQILNNLATLKLKAQEIRIEAMKVRAQVDILFTDEPVSEEQVNSLKEGFKVLKNYAQVNLRYRESRSQAEQARVTLDQALQSASVEPRITEKVSIEAPSPEPTNPETAPEEQLAVKSEIKPETKSDKSKKAS
jgi:hypothetical protein